MSERFSVLVVAAAGEDERASAATLQDAAQLARTVKTMFAVVVKDNRTGRRMSRIEWERNELANNG